MCVRAELFCVRRAPESDPAANTGKNWHKYGAVRTMNTEGGKTAVEFEPRSRDMGGHRSGRRPSLAVALFRTFIGYYAWSGVLLLGYSLIMFVNPFLLK